MVTYCVKKPCFSVVMHTNILFVIVYVVHTRETIPKSVWMTLWHWGSAALVAEGVHGHSKQKEKRNISPHHHCQSSANPSHALRPGSSQACSPSLSGSRGFVTMQLTLALIREVRVRELRTYGFSKDIEWFMVVAVGCV